jgi:hypothetical protein
MTIPYGCRLNICTLGDCDPLSPALGCPLYPEVFENLPGCIGNSDERSLVRANGQRELDPNNVSVPTKDVCVSASRHEDLVP